MNTIKYLLLKTRMDFRFVCLLLSSMLNYVYSVVNYFLKIILLFVELIKIEENCDWRILLLFLGRPGSSFKLVCLFWNRNEHFYLKILRCPKQRCCGIIAITLEETCCKILKNDLPYWLIFVSFNFFAFM